MRLYDSLAPQGTPPFLWFAAVQGIKRKQNLIDLPPQGYFVSVESIESEAR
jgi:hypothetical protein